MDTYQYELVKKLSFLRFGGTDGELRAAEILSEEIEKCGGKGETEEFKIPAYRFDVCSVRVTSPYERELDCVAWGLSGGFPKGGAELEFFYAEDCSEAALYGINDLSGKAVLVNELKLEQYKALYERGASAILIISGRWYESKETSDILQRHARPQYLETGRIPTFFVWAKDAMEMVRDEARTLHIELEQDEFENTSRNITAVIEGTAIKDESIVITAHYDSVNVGTGSWDNATGAATAMYIYRYFKENPPKRTLRFVWCGSEEQGLCGSKAYIEAHPELIEKEIRFCFNFDMCGTILGVNSFNVTGGDDLKHYTEAFCREYGVNAAVCQEVRSSDSACFSDKGIPSVDIIRRTSTANIHTRYDLLDVVSAKQLKKDGDLAVAMIGRVANSARLPIGTGMPDNMKEKLDRYFQRKK